ncbi:hypothetical protein ACH5RR_003791 [Cinchona calisaya]|uniref:Uncharacterized protein n=1 Tax=Cinchona calisaya TaxID=153742 RepID=A0ABD3AVR0_9GENT
MVVADELEGRKEGWCGDDGGGRKRGRDLIWVMAEDVGDGKKGMVVTMQKKSEELRRRRDWVVAIERKEEEELEDLVGGGITQEDKVGRNKRNGLIVVVAMATSDRIEEEDLVGLGGGEG